MDTRRELIIAADVLGATADHFGTPDQLIDPRDSGLTALGRLDALTAVIRDAQAAAVTQARAAGATWSDVGHVLGITRQAAHERFSRA